MTITLAELAASFVVSYVGNIVPIPFKSSLKKRIVTCYNKARKEWKCQAVRERYEGKEFMLIEELKQFVIYKNGVMWTFGVIDFAPKVEVGHFG